MSKSQKRPQVLPELESEDTQTNPESGLNRLERFLKAKAANQHRPDKGGAKHAYSAHTKLKERVRRRP